MAPGRCSFPKLLGGLILVLILQILVPILVVLWKVVGQRGLYDHDHHPLHSPEDEESFSEEGCVWP